jgi:hypothetical protein
MGAGQVAYAAARRPLAASWPLWILGLVVLGGLGWYFLGDREQQLAEQTRGLINKVTEDVATNTPNAADVSADLTASVDSVRKTLQGITDPASARAALPKLQQATEKLDKINSLAAQLPPKPLDRRNSFCFFSGPVHFQSRPWCAAGNAAEFRAGSLPLWSKRRCRRSTGSATRRYRTRRSPGWLSRRSTRCAQSCNRWRWPDSSTERSAQIVAASRFCWRSASLTASAEPRRLDRPAGPCGCVLAKTGMKRAIEY